MQYNETDHSTVVNDLVDDLNVDDIVDVRELWNRSRHDEGADVEITIGRHADASSILQLIRWDSSWTAESVVADDDARIRITLVKHNADQYGIVFTENIL